MKGETFGACMIVKNEESCLGKCLDSIKGLDEVVILDTGSTDKTGDIARARGATIIEGVYEWEDDFSKARNFALRYASADWILVIDADETISDGGIEIIREAIEKVDEKVDVFKLDCVSAEGGAMHCVVRVHRRRSDIFWKGPAHNYLTHQDGPKLDAVITYGWSKAHELDPDRTLRILRKAVAHNPTKPRELYYLGNEYFRRGFYREAKDAYERYLAVDTWTPQVADAWLMLGKCGIGLDDMDMAWQSICHALRINADLKEGIQMLALLSGPENRRKWLEYSKCSTNNKAHFIRDVPGLDEITEKDAAYYKRIFDTNPDLSRYEELYKTVASMCSCRVLDMGCGTGELKKHMPDYCLYHGFDFTESAKGEGFSLGDIYEYPLEGHQTFVMLEVLEHVDDLRVLRRIPPASTVIFSVPSFPDPAHLRTYTLEMMTDRFSEFFNAMEVRRFNLINGKWMHVDQDTDAYILLCKAVKK